LEINTILNINLIALHHVINLDHLVLNHLLLVLLPVRLDVVPFHHLHVLLHLRV
jgi:hypothetical protein